MSSIVAVIWAMIGIVVYRNFAPPPAAPAPAAIVVPIEPTPGIVPAEPTGKAMVGIEILRDARLIQLKLFGEVPLEVKAMGRADPFSLINP